MFLRLDGAAVTGVTPGNALTTWPDTSGHGRHATTTGSGVVPKWITAGTLPAGGDAGMAWYNPFDTGGSENGGLLPESSIDTGTGWTYYLWFRAFDAASAQVLWQDNAGGGQPQLIWVSTGKFGWRDAGGTHEIAAATTGWHSLIYVFAGVAGTGTGTVYYDGVSAGTATWDWSTAGVTGYIMGANQISNANWDGWMAEFIGFAGAHDAATRQAMRSYLAAKWTWG
jgi:hypothetical protein